MIQPSEDKFAPKKEYESIGGNMGVPLVDPGHPAASIPEEPMVSGDRKAVLGLNDDVLHQIYDNSSQEYDVGSFDDFKSNMSDPENRYSAYVNFKDSGYDVPDTFDEFEHYINPSVDEDYDPSDPAFNEYGHKKRDNAYKILGELSDMSSSHMEFLKETDGGFNQIVSGVRNSNLDDDVKEATIDSEWDKYYLKNYGHKPSESTYSDNVQIGKMNQAAKSKGISMSEEIQERNLSLAEKIYGGVDKTLMNASHLEEEISALGRKSPEKLKEVKLITEIQKLERQMAKFGDAESLESDVVKRKISEAQRKVSDIRFSRMQGNDEKIDKYHDILSNGTGEVNDIRDAYKYLGIPVEDDLDSYIENPNITLGVEQRDVIQEAINKRLEEHNQFIKPNEELAKDAVDAFDSKFPKTQLMMPEGLDNLQKFQLIYHSMYEKYDEWVNTAYQDRFRRDGFVDGAASTLKEYGRVATDVFSGADEEENYYAALGAFLTKNADLALLNESTLDNTAKGIVDGASKFGGEVGDTAFKSVGGNPILEARHQTSVNDARNTLEIIRSAGITDDAAFGEESKKELDAVFDFETKKEKSSGLGDREFWSTTTGEAVGLMVQIASGGGYGKAAVGATKVGSAMITLSRVKPEAFKRIIQSSAYLSRLKNGNKLSSLIVRSAPAASKALSSGISYQSAGLVFNKNEELNFLSGVMGSFGRGVYDKMAQKVAPIMSNISKIFGKDAGKVKDALIKAGQSKAIRHGVGGGIGEVFEEHSQTIASAFIKSHGNLFESIGKEYGTSGDAFKMTVASFVMGMFMGGGETAIGKAHIRDANSGMESLSDQEQEVVSNLINRFTKESAEAQSEVVAEELSKVKEDAESVEHGESTYDEDGDILPIDSEPKKGSVTQNMSKSPDMVPVGESEADSYLDDPDYIKASESDSEQMMQRADLGVVENYKHSGTIIDGIANALKKWKPTRRIGEAFAKGASYYGKSGNRAIKDSENTKANNLSFEGQKIEQTAKLNEKRLNALTGKNGELSGVDMKSLHSDMYKALQGEDVTLPHQITPIVKELRSAIDKMQMRLIATGVEGDKAKQAIYESMGSWVNRTYAKHENVNHAKTVDKADIDASKAIFMEDGMTEEDASSRIEKIMASPKRKGQFSGDKNIESQDRSIFMARDQAKKYKKFVKSIEDQIEVAKAQGETSKVSALEDHLDATVESDFDIPEHVRKLMGEETNPFQVFRKSMAKASSMVEHKKMLESISFLGEEGGWISDIKTDSNSVEIEGNRGENPLKGKFSSPEIAEALNAFDRANSDGGSVQAILGWVNSVSAQAKTIMSPGSTLANVVSATLHMVATGNVEAMASSMGWQTVKDLYSSLDAESEFHKKMQKAMWEYSIVNQGIKARELHENTRKNVNKGGVLDAIKGSASPKKGSFIGKLSGARDSFISANKTAYEAGDNIPKSLTFTQEVIDYAKANESFQEIYRKNEFDTAKSFEEFASSKEFDNVLAQAGRIASLTNPTYDKVPEFINMIRSKKWLTTFVSFPAEVIRTTTNIAMVSFSEMKSGNSHIRNKGIKRLTGLMAHRALFLGLAYSMKQAMGMSDEEEEAVRGLIPPYHENSNLLFLGKDDDGNIKYLDMGRYDSMGMLSSLITTFKRKGAGEFFSELGKPYYSESFSTNLIKALATNKDTYGRDIANKEDKLIHQSIDILGHVRKNLMQNGYTKLVSQLYESEFGEKSNKYGKVADAGDAVKGFFGMRAFTVDPSKSIHFKAKEIDKRMGDATSIYYSNKNESTKARANEIGKRISEEYNDLIKYGKALGMSEKEILEKILKATRKFSTLSKGKLSDISEKSYVPIK